jgi:DeoR family transcriptional regulator of aga operon
VPIGERHERIIELLVEREAVSVSELSAILDVSPVTIRSDLNQLAEQGKATRTHGGARITGERARQEYTYTTRQRLNAEQKHQIGQCAARLVRPGEAILLDASTTAAAVGQALKERADLAGVTVVTTGIWTALEMLGAPAIQVVLAGGTLRTTTGSITGSIAEEVLGRFNFHRAFLGAWGLTPEDGLTDTPLVEVELKRMMVKYCQELTAVVDSSKFGQTAVASFAGVADVARIITDPGAPFRMLRRFENAGVEVLIADST